MALRRCVQCRKAPVDPDWRPFCSERCKLLDLSNWVDGRYRVAGERTTVEDGDSQLVVEPRTGRPAY